RGPEREDVLERADGDRVDGVDDESGVVRGLCADTVFQRLELSVSRSQRRIGRAESSGELITTDNADDAADGDGLEEVGVRTGVTRVAAGLDAVSELLCSDGLTVRPLLAGLDLDREGL